MSIVQWLYLIDFDGMAKATMNAITSLLPEADVSEFVAATIKIEDRDEPWYRNLWAQRDAVRAPKV